MSKTASGISGYVYTAKSIGDSFQPFYRFTQK